MNTPAHIAAGLFVWRNESSQGAASAVVLGALLPDLPMFAFYGFQKLIAGSSEREIWSDLYFRSEWQLFFDVFNSIPLLALVTGISYAFGFRWGVLLGGSALLHLFCDLPVHHDDAHRHFLPFTNWRFASPVSYWDPKHFGVVFMCCELILAITACIYVCWKGQHNPMKSAAAATLALYFAGIIFAAVMWLPQLAGDTSHGQP